MKKDPTENEPSKDVPRRIFEEFLKRLQVDDKVSGVAVERLTALLLSEKSLTEKAVTDALFSEHPIS